MLMRLSIEPIEITRSGLLWPSRVLPSQESSHLTELFQSIAAKFGTSNQFQFLILQLTQTREQDLSLTWLNSTENAHKVNLEMLEMENM